MSKRHFTEKEVAQILRRASAMQASSGQAPDSVSTDELVRVASEVGIEARFMEAAISEVDAVDLDEGQTRWLGAPPAYELERFSEGQLDETAWLRIVAELNSTFHQGNLGTVSGPVRMWHHKHDTGSMTFTATQGPSSVRLKMSIYLDDGLAMGMVFTILAMLLTLAPAFAMDDVAIWVRLMFPLVLSPLIWLGFTRIVRGWYSKERVKMGRLMDIFQRLAANGQTLELETLRALQEQEHLTLDVDSS